MSRRSRHRQQRQGDQPAAQAEGPLPALPVELMARIGVEAGMARASSCINKETRPVMLALPGRSKLAVPASIPRVQQIQRLYNRMPHLKKVEVRSTAGAAEMSSFLWHLWEGMPPSSIERIADLDLQLGSSPTRWSIGDSLILAPFSKLEKLSISSKGDLRILESAFKPLANTCPTLADLEVISTGGSLTFSNEDVLTPLAAALRRAKLMQPGPRDAPHQLVPVERALAQLVNLEKLDLAAPLDSDGVEGMLRALPHLKQLILSDTSLQPRDQHCSVHAALVGSATEVDLMSMAHRPMHPGHPGLRGALCLKVWETAAAAFEGEPPYLQLCAGETVCIRFDRLLRFGDTIADASELLEDVVGPWQLEQLRIEVRDLVASWDAEDGARFGAAARQACRGVQLSVDKLLPDQLGAWHAILAAAAGSIVSLEVSSSSVHDIDFFPAAVSFPRLSEVKCTGFTVTSLRQVLWGALLAPARFPRLDKFHFEQVCRVELDDDADDDDDVETLTPPEVRLVGVGTHACLRTRGLQIVRA